MTTDLAKKIKEFNFELECPIEYAQKGDMVESNFITLKAPTSKHLDLVSDLKQAFFRAIPKDKEGQESVSDSSGKDVDDIDGEMVMTLIMMSETVDLKNILLIGKELFTKDGIAYLDGEIKLNKPLVDSLDTDDLQRMLGDYMVNFILASSLRTMKKLLSKG